MHTSTPNEISRAVRKLIQRIAPRGEAQYFTVHPAPGAVFNECFPNVEAMVRTAGGKMLCGWQIWEWPHVLVEAEFHSFWLSPEAAMVDITPKAVGESRVLFVPNARLTYTGTSIENVRMPLRDDQLIRDFIRIAEEIVRVLNRGKRVSQFRLVSVPAHEIEPLQVAKIFLGESLTSGRRNHDLCLCGSGAKYKRCHARQVNSILAGAH